MTCRSTPSQIRFNWISSPNVRYGSLADIATSPRHVRFTPITDIYQRGLHVRFVPEADMAALSRG